MVARGFRGEVRALDAPRPDRAGTSLWLAGAAVLRSR
jgi:hypothetical protein